MSIDKAALGAAIKRVRTARGLTQVELAQAAGLSKGGKSIALVEQGKRFVSVDTLNALANALDIPPGCLAILGSRSIGRDREATRFMKDLQGLISSVLLAQAELGPSSTSANVAAGVRKLNKPRRTGKPTSTRHPTQRPRTIAG